MSDIAKAREMIVIANQSIAQAQHCLEFALKLINREPSVKKAPAKFVRITPAIRASVKALKAEGKTEHEIAQLVGLRNGGRVSEILNGKR
jgi:hypothetical protein